MLSHNRKIRIRADDSVMDFYKNEPYMIRRSRGYAPLPTMVQMSWKGQVLATGGELKKIHSVSVWTADFTHPLMWEIWKICAPWKLLKETIGRMETLLEIGTKGCGMRSASEIQCDSCCGRTWTPRF